MHRRVDSSIGVVAFIIVLSGIAHGAGQGPPPPPPPPPPPALITFSGPVAETEVLRPGTALILGRVVDAATGKPMVGVVVRLNAGSGAQFVTGTGTLATPITPALTNPQGQFLFRSLPAGRYTLAAQFGGYLPGAYAQIGPESPSGQLRLTDGERVTDVTIRMWQHGAITGRLLDEEGEPAVGLMVRLLKRTLVGGQNQWVATRQAQTDDRGLYRFGSLAPGEYVVAMTAALATVPSAIGEAFANAMRAGTGATIAPSLQEAAASAAGAGARIGDLQVQSVGNNTVLPRVPTSLDDVLSYQTVYHAAATRLADASRVRVGPGEEKTGIDLQARLARMFRVSGQIVGPDGGPMSVGLTLMPGDGQEISADANFETATAVSGDDGRFTFLGVPPGQYTIRMIRIPRPTGTPSLVTTISMPGGAVGMSSVSLGDVPPAPPQNEPTLWAEMPITVTTHTENVTVVVRAGARIRGTAQFAGTGTPLEPRQRQLVMISFVPVISRGGRQPFPARLSADGAFVSAEYPPGRYFANVTGLPPGWRVRSVLVAGRNALEEPFDLGAGDIEGVAVTVTSQTTELSGTVRGGTAATPHVPVLIFPDDHERWISNGMRATRARTVTTSVDGSFHVTGLLPGAYRVVAIAPGAPSDVQDPALVEALARAGTPITLAEGETRSISLTITAGR